MKYNEMEWNHSIQFNSVLTLIQFASGQFNTVFPQLPNTSVFIHSNKENKYLGIIVLKTGSASKNKRF